MDETLEKGTVPKMLENKRPEYKRSPPSLSLFRQVSIVFHGENLNTALTLTLEDKSTNASKEKNSSYVVATLSGITTSCQHHRPWHNPQRIPSTHLQAHHSPARHPRSS
jgi:hypothetical protein